MDGLLSFLLFAGLFYLMMRFGCGAHMIHGGHRNHKEPAHSRPADIQSIDPVCGMNVALDQGYGKMVEGQLYRFCSRQCLDRFEAEPAKYIEKAISLHKEAS